MITRGSEWHRWEPHIHAPGTAMNNQFTGPTAWDDYLTALEGATPLIEAIAVTDYYVTDTYEEVLRRKAAGRAREQCRSQRRLERVDVASDRRLAQAKPPRRAGQAAVARHLDEGAQLVPVWRAPSGHTLSYSRTTKICNFVYRPASLPQECDAAGPAGVIAKAIVGPFGRHSLSGDREHPAIS